jgi:signal transduction histidine kinase
MSHDMRTPLNGILGYSKLALDEKTMAAKDVYLQKINQAGNTLLGLIDDMLDLQRIENGTIKLEPAPVSCRTVVKTIVTAVQPSLDAKKIHFTIDNSKAVMACINIDLVRVSEIFINLLSNAVKFTPEGGRWILSSSATSWNLTASTTGSSSGITVSVSPRVPAPDL